MTPVELSTQRPVAGLVAGHQPVLLREVVAALRPVPDGRYIDGTFGGGGHAEAVLCASSPTGRLLAIDADPEAIARAEELAATVGTGRLRVNQGTFADLNAFAADAGFDPADGILLDLGLSSFQLDDPGRGFAFRLDGPLDMRFDPSRGAPASNLVNELPADALADIFWRYGEERASRKIAAAIVTERLRHPIETTGELAAVVRSALRGRRAAFPGEVAQTFQALRIAVNDEFGALEHGLEGAVSSLGPGGRLAVISFHSLEDRIVKRFFAKERGVCVCPPEQPICTCNPVARLIIIGKPIKASSDERERNPRARSATLRVTERLSDPVE